MDRPLVSAHPRHPEMIYPVNYGYVPGVLAPEGVSFTREQIEELTRFQEQYFQSEVRMEDTQ